MLIFYGHPFSSYSWKAQIALYEKGIDFEYRNVDPEFPEHGPELRGHWPIGKFPLIVHDGQPWFEASIIIEYLDQFHPGPVRFIPDDPDRAREVRIWDRFFDLYVSTPMQKADLPITPASVRSPRRSNRRCSACG